MTGKRQFLTPPPQEGAQLGAFLISGVDLNQWIIGLIDGALLNLKESWQFEQVELENMTPDEASQYFENLEMRLIVSLCQEIADCLSDSDSPAYDVLINAIQTGVGGGSGSNTQSPVFTGDSSGVGGQQDRTLAKDECDSDLVFGFCTQLVDLLNSTIEDLFQIVEAGSNIAERAGIVVENIPFVNQAIDVADQIAEEGFENYSAYYTETLRNQFRCDLFCMMMDKPDCHLMFSEMANYFIGLGGGSVSNVAVGVALESLAEGLIAGSSTVYAMHAILCTALQYGSDFMGINTGQLQKLCQSFLNDPDSDWTTLCDDCPQCASSGDFNFTTEQCFEIGNVDGGVNPTSNGVWVDGTGFVSVQTSGGSATIEIYYLIPESTLTSLSMTANRQGSQNAYTQAYIRYASGGSARVINGDLDSGNLSWSGSEANVVGVSFVVYGGNTGTQEYRITGAHIGVA